MAISLQHRLRVLKAKFSDFRRQSKGPGLRFRRHLTFRHIIWGAVGVLVVLFYLYAQIVVSPYQKRYTVLMREIQESRNLNSVFADKVSRVLKNQKNEETFTQYTEGTLSGFSEMLLSLVEEGDLTVETVRYMGEEENRSGIVGHDYELTLQGGYSDLGELLFGLSESRYLIEILQVDLSTGPIGQDLVMALKLTVYLPKEVGVSNG